VLHQPKRAAGKATAGAGDDATATPDPPSGDDPDMNATGDSDNGDSDDGTDEGGGDGILVASPTQPMAVPSLMLPWELGCVDDLSD